MFRSEFFRIGHSISFCGVVCIKIICKFSSFQLKITDIFSTLLDQKIRLDFGIDVISCCPNDIIVVVKVFQLELMITSKKRSRSLASAIVPENIFHKFNGNYRKVSFIEETSWSRSLPVTMNTEAGT